MKGAQGQLLPLFPLTLAAWPEATWTLGTGPAGRVGRAPALLGTQTMQRTGPQLCLC